MRKIRPYIGLLPWVVIVVAFVPSLSAIFVWTRLRLASADLLFPLVADGLGVSYRLVMPEKLFPRQVPPGCQSEGKERAWPMTPLSRGPARRRH
jgi:hypothetical protein